MSIEKQAVLSQLFGFEFLGGGEPYHFDIAAKYFSNMASDSFGLNNLFVGLAENPAINAVATTPGFDAVVFTTGLIDALQVSCTIHGQLPGVYAWLEPAERKDISEWLFSRSVDFIFLHELAHLLHGHTRLMNQEHGVAYIAEVQPTPALAQLKLDMQTMEYDADTFAVNVVIISALSGRLPAVRPNPDWEQDFEGATMVYLCLTTIYAFFKLIEDEYDKSKIETSSHPPVVYRMALAWQVALDTVIRRRAISDNVKRRFAIILKQFEEALPERVARPFDEHRIDEVFGADTWSYFQRILDNYVKLHPRLLPHAIGPLPPVQGGNDVS